MATADDWRQQTDAGGGDEDWRQCRRPRLSMSQVTPHDEDDNAVPQRVLLGTTMTDDNEQGRWEPDADRRQHAAVLVFTRDRCLGERRWTAPLLHHDASSGGNDDDDDDGQQHAVVYVVVVEVCKGFFYLFFHFFSFFYFSPAFYSFFLVISLIHVQ